MNVCAKYRISRVDPVSPGIQFLSLLIHNPDAGISADDDIARAIRDSGLLVSCHTSDQGAVEMDGHLGYGNLDLDGVMRGLRATACQDPSWLRSAFDLATNGLDDAIETRTVGIFPIAVAGRRA